MTKNPKKSDNLNAQRLHNLKINKLKSIKDMEISFKDKDVTAILGPNASGKSTILHALACIYSPQTNGENHKFSNFFLPSTDALWKNSEFEITHSYQLGADKHEDLKREYKKSSDRWSPRYSNRPKRDVFYIGIEVCVPMIEKEKTQTKVNYSTTINSNNHTQTILDKASYILNKRYDVLKQHELKKKSFIGVEAENLKYSALSMSAGEQKVFYILNIVFLAPKYSLILIDELDLLLHDLSFQRLVEVIAERAKDKKIQIVFTTHRESVIKLSDKINIRHVLAQENKTLCFDSTTPALIDRLTGEQSKPIEIFVEDDLSEAIIRHLSISLNIGKYLEITRFGACTNAFTTIAGLLLSNKCPESILAVIDGDLYTTDEEIEKRINTVLSGNDYAAEQNRKVAKSMIKKYNLPSGNTPEEYIYNSITSDSFSVPSNLEEFVNTAKELGIPSDKHEFLSKVIEKIGLNKEVGLAQFVEIFSQTQEWNNFILSIRNWLEEQKSKLGI